MNRRQFRLRTAAIAALAAGVVFLVATELFPYHTPNHDEGVYLQQAAMLLDGKLAVRPPVPDSLRPWFFVRDGPRLYPKYSPVPAAMFAVGKLLGTVRVSLAGIAAANVALTAAVAAEAFDRRTGLLAGVFLLASPLFLLDSAVFLPYAPTTFLNLLFALAYVRAARRDSRGYALLAGLAVGAAFFARPYTAVLFAAPFVVHACYSLAVGFSRRRLARLSLTALGGLTGVAAALAYNAAMTGSPWLFPYEAFAPRDGLGFGHREILGYAREYTPALALRANAEVVSVLFTDWVVAGPLGTLLAALGVGVFAREALRSPERTGDGLPGIRIGRSSEFTDAQAAAVLAGLFVSVVLGNVYFWGNLNVLGELADPTDGLVDILGPYYHFDLLVPTAAFAARGALFAFDRVRSGIADRTARFGSPDSRRVTVSVAVVGLLLLAGTTGAVLEPTVSENASITDEYERAYQPVEQRDLSNAVVFLPTPYGDWLNHPFQHLRNDPGFDGDAVYAASDGGDDLAVAAAYPNRTYYRYVYRGTWAPSHGESVRPALREVRVVRGDAVGVAASVGVPSHADRVSVRISSNRGATYYALNGTPETVSLDLQVANGSARIVGPDVRPVGENRSVPVADEDEVVVQVFVSDATGGGFSYRLELPVRTTDGGAAALSPYREVCFVPDRCGGEAAYIEGAVPPNTSLEAELYARTNQSRS